MSTEATSIRSRIEAGDLSFLDGLVLLGTIASKTVQPSTSAITESDQPSSAGRKPSGRW